MFSLQNLFVLHFFIPFLMFIFSHLFHYYIYRSVCVCVPKISKEYVVFFLVIPARVTPKQSENSPLYVSRGSFLIRRIFPPLHNKTFRFRFLFLFRSATSENSSERLLPREPAYCLAQNYWYPLFLK